LYELPRINTLYPDAIFLLDLNISFNEIVIQLRAAQETVIDIKIMDCLPLVPGYTKKSAEGCDLMVTSVPITKRKK
jgi:hypothetical protein